MFRLTLENQILKNDHCKNDTMKWFEFIARFQLKKRKTSETPA